MIDLSARGYETLRAIGQGQFGRACLVRKIDTGALRIAKTVDLSNLEAGDALRAGREPGFLNTVREHPAFVKLYEHFKHQETLVIIMEYCQGGDMAHLLKGMRITGTFFPESEIILMIRQLAEAVMFIHENFILHLDLKPSNIFLAGDGRLKVADFGVSRRVSGTWPAARTSVGTPQYMPPEMMQNKSYTLKSDIWSLGCLIYEMVALRPAFEGSNPCHLAFQVCCAHPARLSNNYSEPLKELILSLLAKEPRNRPSAAQLLESPYLCGTYNIFDSVPDPTWGDYMNPASESSSGARSTLAETTCPGSLEDAEHNQSSTSFVAPAPEDPADPTVLRLPVTTRTRQSSPSACLLPTSSPLTPTAGSIVLPPKALCSCCKNGGTPQDRQPFSDHPRSPLMRGEDVGNISPLSASLHRPIAEVFKYCDIILKRMQHGLQKSSISCLVAMMMSHESWKDLLEQLRNISRVMCGEDKETSDLERVYQSFLVEIVSRQFHIEEETGAGEWLGAPPNHPHNPPVDNILDDDVSIEWLIRTSERFPLGISREECELLCHSLKPAIRFSLRAFLHFTRVDVPLSGSSISNGRAGGIGIASLTHVERAYVSAAQIILHPEVYRHPQGGCSSSCTNNGLCHPLLEVSSFMLSPSQSCSFVLPQAAVPQLPHAAGENNGKVHYSQANIRETLKANCLTAKGSALEDVIRIANKDIKGHINWQQTLQDVLDVVVSLRSNKFAGAFDSSPQNFIPASRNSLASLTPVSTDINHAGTQISEHESASSLFQGGQSSPLSGKWEREEELRPSSRPKGRWPLLNEGEDGVSSGKNRGRQCTCSPMNGGRSESRSRSRANQEISTPPADQYSTRVGAKSSELLVSESAYPRDDSPHDLDPFSKPTSKPQKHDGSATEGRRSMHFKPAAAVGVNPSHNRRSSRRSSSPENAELPHPSAAIINPRVGGRRTPRPVFPDRRNGKIKPVPERDIARLHRASLEDYDDEGRWLLLFPDSRFPPEYVDTVVVDDDYDSRESDYWPLISPATTLPNCNSEATANRSFVALMARSILANEKVVEMLICEFQDARQVNAQSLSNLQSKAIVEGVNFLKDLMARIRVHPGEEEQALYLITNEMVKDLNGLNAWVDQALLKLKIALRQPQSGKAVGVGIFRKEVVDYTIWYAWKLSLHTQELISLIMLLSRDFPAGVVLRGMDAEMMGVVIARRSRTLEARSMNEKASVASKMGLLKEPDLLGDTDHIKTWCKHLERSHVPRSRSSHDECHENEQYCHYLSAGGCRVVSGDFAPHPHIICDRETKRDRHRGLESRQSYTMQLPPRGSNEMLPLRRPVEAKFLPRMLSSELPKCSRPTKSSYSCDGSPYRNEHNLRRQCAAVPNQRGSPPGTTDSMDRWPRRGPAGIAFVDSHRSGEAVRWEHQRPLSMRDTSSSYSSSTSPPYGGRGEYHHHDNEDNCDSAPWIGNAQHKKHGDRKEVPNYSSRVARAQAGQH